MNIKPTQEGLTAFLASPSFKGIGKVTAEKIVNKFGDEILDPEFNFPERFNQESGLSEKIAEEIRSGFSTLKADPELIALLYSAGMKDSEVEKVVGHYGKRLGKVMDFDPYDMVENVWKFSFFSADKIGRFLGIDKSDPRRLRGALLTSVKLHAEEGNMFATEQQALQTASRISGVEEEKIRLQIELLVEEKRLVKNMGGLYLPVYFKAEEEAADKIRQLLSLPEENSEDFVIPVTDLQGHKLTQSQRDAIDMVMRNKVSIITGGPGTGKTTILNGLISVLMGMNKKTVLAAPTGRAAKRMSDITGEEAKTIHRLLGYSMGKGYRNKKFDTDILIIDEASMLEQVLFNHLLQALRPDTRVVLVGDPDQLPPIGAGNVFKDMIASHQIPTITLEENFRQAPGSVIASNAMKIKEGEIPGKEISDEFLFIDESNIKSIHSRLLSLTGKEIPSYTGISSSDIQVVTPQQEGPLGAKQLNIDLQEYLNPDAPEIKKGVKKFRLGDRVMQTANSSQRKIYNGETGKVTALNAEAGYLDVTFNDGKISRYFLNELKELTLAYATTVHKLQGTETDYIVMVVSSSHKPLLYRNLLYTAVSRAKKLCVVVGDEKALATAVANTERNRRASNFKNRLIASGAR